MACAPTESMRRAIDETDRRRSKQVAYNEANGITPRTIVKNIDASLVEMYSPEWAVVPEIDSPAKTHHDDDMLPALELSDRISDLRRQMMDSADKLNYERAAELRAYGRAFADSSGNGKTSARVGG